MSLKVGIVGARGLSSVAGFNEHPKTTVTALCDLNQELAEAEAARHGIPNTFRVFEDMLAGDIDIVVIGTPMQLHVPQAIKALEAGKHVLSEVTAGVTMDEMWWLIDAVEASGKTYMMAENYLYIPQNQIITNMVRDGLFGDVYFGEGEYLHEAFDLTTYPDGSTSWRKYWQFGKRGTFYPTHSLGPVMQWFADDHVAGVSTFTAGHRTGRPVRQDDLTVTVLQMKSGKLIKLRVDCLSPRPHNLAFYSLQGTKGAYEAPRGLGDDHKVWLSDMDADTAHAKWRPLSEFEARYLPDRYRNATAEQRQTGHWGGDFFIVQDFVDAVVNGTRPPVDVYDACEWTAVGLLSELSVTNGGRAIEMPAFSRGRPLEEQIIRLP